MRSVTSVTSFQYLHNFAPTLDNFSKTFSIDTKFGYFTVHWSTAALKFFKENLSTNFGLIILLIHMFSWFFEIAPVYLRLAGCRVYKGHLQNK